MKKTVISLVLAVVLSLCIAVPAFGAVGGMTVFVTIADGELCIANAAVEVSDVDGDENLTLNDALILAHERYYKGGAEKG